MEGFFLRNGLRLNGVGNGNGLPFFSELAELDDLLKMMIGGSKTVRDSTLVSISLALN